MNYRTWLLICSIIFGCLGVFILVVPTYPMALLEVAPEKHEPVIARLLGMVLILFGAFLIAVHLLLHRSNRARIAIDDGPAVKSKDRHIDLLVSHLRHSADETWQFAVAITFIVMLALVAVYTLFNFHFVPHEARIIKELAEKRIDPTPLVTFYMVSRIVIGGFLTAVFIWLFRICAGSFDQSVRFRKRKHSTLFLRYLFESVEVKAASLKEVVDSYTAWTNSIDSAFTPASKVTAKGIVEQVGSAIEAVVRRNNSDHKDGSSK